MKNIFEDLDEEELTDRMLYRRCSSDSSVTIWDDGEVIIHVPSPNWMIKNSELDEIVRKSKLFCTKRQRFTYKKECRIKSE